jgi:hypothetical protein
MGSLDWTHLLVQAAIIVVPVVGGQLLLFKKMQWERDQFPLHNHLNGRITYPDGVDAKARGLALYIGQRHHSDD